MKRNLFFLCSGSVLFLGLAVIKPVMASEDDDKTLKQVLEDLLAAGL
jgi:hypothetical protein